SSDNSNIESAIMYNMLGQKVGFNTSKNNNLQLPVSNISSGSVLIIKATLDNGSVITKKLIKL
ncbi:MAG TPA: T9SS type A sorting domain-containing protein, partial [Flavobacteriaceae bacterium]|nr:T9SS type A sorting domain-containing protein [Flavobacteriaceae bacterium]